MSTLTGKLTLGLRCGTPVGRTEEPGRWWLADAGGASLIGRRGWIRCSSWFPASTDQEVVRAEGVEPSRALRPYGFSYRFGFRRPGLARARRLARFAVWTIPSPSRG